MTAKYSIDLELDVTPAVAPPEITGQGRDDVRLLAIDQRSKIRVNTHFRSIADFFRPGDLLVVNNSAAIPAALPARIAGRAHVLFLAARQGPGRVICELRQDDGAPDWSEVLTGAAVEVLDGSGQAASWGRVLRRFHPRSRFWVIETDHDWYALAQTLGQPIRYHYVDRPHPIAAYQTLFSRIPGSSEMPSASRPFTPETMANLFARGVSVAEITLHTSVSSHEIADNDDAPPLVPEWFHIPTATRQLVQEAHREGRSIIALGTTVARALETWASTDATQGWTTHLITPETPPKLVSGLVTGLHDSFTSHLWLLYAFLPEADLKDAYQDAERWGFRWHEFGDLSLIR